MHCINICLDRLRDGCTYGMTLMNVLFMVIHIHGSLSLEWAITTYNSSSRCRKHEDIPQAQAQAQEADSSSVCGTKLIEQHNNGHPCYYVPGTTNWVYIRIDKMNEYIHTCSRTERGAHPVSGLHTYSPGKLVENINDASLVNCKAVGTSWARPSSVGYKQT